MTLLIQVSDPHFGTERPAVVAALERLVRAQSPQLLLLSGDITQRARTAQFRAAKAFVDRLGVPSLVIPGNHDIPLGNLWGRLTDPYAHYRRAFGQELEPVFESPELLVVGLNTTRPWRHKHGEVSPRQIEHTAARLQRATPRQLRLVLTHQPMAVLRDQDAPNLLRGRGPALRRWARAGVDLVLGGHIHLPYLTPVLVPADDLQQPARRVWVLQAGTALSSRTRDGINNSVNLLRLDAPRAGVVDGVQRGCSVERWDYHPADNNFVCVNQTALHFPST